MEIGEDERMSLKLVGALCVIAACGSFGFMMAAHHLRLIRRMQNLIVALEYMECELQYRCTPLPQLCRQASQMCKGKVQTVFLSLAEELDAQISPNVQRCMEAVVGKLGDMENTLQESLFELGRKLGTFDLAGQVQGLNSTRQMCEAILSQLSKNRDSRMRSYQTLGLCAGAALAILFV